MASKTSVVVAWAAPINDKVVLKSHASINEDDKDRGSLMNTKEDEVRAPESKVLPSVYATSLQPKLYESSDNLVIHDE